MLCEDIMMDDVVCLAPTDTAQVAACKMRDLNVGFLPVCDASGKAIGTLTDRDLAIRVITENRSLETLVSTLMTKEVITCRPKDDIQRAQYLMAEHQKSRIVVVRNGGGVAGGVCLFPIPRKIDCAPAAWGVGEGL